MKSLTAAMSPAYCWRWDAKVLVFVSFFFQFQLNLFVTYNSNGMWFLLFGWEFPRQEGS